jgi:cysteinyl-tRNA synthetase
MPLVLTNTLTRKKQLFTPHNAQRVSMYVCGITPQEAPHLGHGRGYIVTDILFRLLRHTYGKEHVTYVRNYTDVDDKIIEKAAQSGRTPQQVADENIAIFERCMKDLNIIDPTEQPRITTSMPAILEFIGRLMARNIAYQTPKGDVYFNLAALPTCGCGYHYGQLSGKKPEELIMGSRVEPNPLKKNPGDFALWKAAKPGEPSWPPTWPEGRPGRPGWHIECSAMSNEILGPKLDIHGGGEDLQFPHHENELAQNVGAFSNLYTSPEEGFARLWFHWAFITVNGTKMSKSLGNFTYLHEAIATYGAAALRYWLLQTHYRKPVDFSETALRAAAKPAKRLTDVLKHKDEGEIYASLLIQNEPTEAFQTTFIAALEDDLNTAKALAALNTALSKAEYHNVVWGAQMLGFRA